MEVASATHIKVHFILVLVFSQSTRSCATHIKASNKVLTIEDFPCVITNYDDIMSDIVSEHVRSFIQDHVDDNIIEDIEMMTIEQ